MKNNEIIKQAQAECGEYVTGYKGDITCDSLKAICNKIWNRCVNLSYTFVEFRMEMSSVVGVKAYNFFLVDILDFMNEKENLWKYCMFHGKRYCL